MIKYAICSRVQARIAVVPRSLIFKRLNHQHDLKVQANLKLRNTLEMIGTVTKVEFSDPESKFTKDLAKVIINTPNYKHVRKIKVDLIDKFPDQYEVLKNSLIQVSSEPVFLNMIMYSRICKEQYGSFLENLRATISTDNKLTIQEKQYKLYQLIHCQRTLHPFLKKGTSLVIPDDIHCWFYNNLSKDDTFNHYHFLIQNDVNLSSSTYIRKLTPRLLQGSESEKQLATFEYFFHGDKIMTDKKIEGKFVSLHNFYDIFNLTNHVVRSKKFNNLKFYLQCIVEKLVNYRKINIHNVDNEKKMALVFARFINEILLILANTGDIKLFLNVLKVHITLLKDNKFLEREEYLKLMHRPIIQIFKLLRTNKDQDSIFVLISVVGNMQIAKNYKFKNILVNELIQSLRYFNDPKLLCQFFISAIEKPNPAKLLNELGLWGSTFHSVPNKLPENILDEEINSMDKMVPKSLRTSVDKLSLPLTELYRVILSNNSIMMKPAEYRELIINLYTNYVQVMEKNHGNHFFWKHNTSILKVILNNILFNLKDKKLAYDMLRDFYSHKFSKQVKNIGDDCPFSIVLYGNHDLTQIQVLDLLSLMDEQKFPLSFKVCASMVFRYLKWEDLESAEQWYKKILLVNFPLNHLPLIKVIHQNGWEFPANFDESLLSTSMEGDSNGAFISPYSELSKSEDETDLLIQESDDQASTINDNNINELIALVKNI